MATFPLPADARADQVVGPEVPVILAVHTPRGASPAILTHLVRRLRDRLRGRPSRRRQAGVADADSALVRALCHDMRGSLACLEAALRSLESGGTARGELLVLARAQAAHLASMLRTAEATGSGPSPSRVGDLRLPDVVAASVEVSGLPRRQLAVELSEAARNVLVGDTRLQRILVNLLENAHRHGGGAPVRLVAAAAGGRVELTVTQPGVPAALVAGHLRAASPPVQLTGLGLWSVQQLVRQLGGRIVCEDGPGGLALRVQLPDR